MKFEFLEAEKEGRLYQYSHKSLHEVLPQR